MIRKTLSLSAGMKFKFVILLVYIENLVICVNCEIIYIYFRGFCLGTKEAAPI